MHVCLGVCVIHQGEYVKVVWCCVCVWFGQLRARGKRESFTFIGLGIGISVFCIFGSPGMGDRSMRVFLHVSLVSTNGLGV